MKYHINPETGTAGACKARVKPCPFLAPGEHYESKEQALESYEQIMAGRIEAPLSWSLGKPNSPLKGIDDFQGFTKANFDEYKSLDLTKDEEKAFNYYSITGFEYINRFLRGQPLLDPEAPANPFYPADHEEQMLELAKETIAAVDKVFERNEAKKRVTYRYSEPPKGMDSATFLQSLLEKGTYKDSAYLSTSASVDWPLTAVLEEAGKKDRFLLEIVSEDNLVIQRKETPYPGHIQSLENEVLINRDVEFEVVGIDLKRKVGFGDAKKIMSEHLRVYDARQYKLQDKIERQEYFRLPVIQLVQKRK